MKKMKSILALSLFLNYFTPFAVLASEVDEVPSEETVEFEESLTTTPPSITDFGLVFHQNATLTDQTIEGNIYVGPDAILTLSNVTVTGNVYVLGALYATNVTCSGTLAAHSVHFEDVQPLVNGMAIILEGNKFNNTTSTNTVITDIPIEFGENPVKSVDGMLTLAGNTVAVADMYINGTPIEVQPDGSFSVNDIQVGDATTFNVTWATVFGHTIEKTFEVDPNILSPSGVIHHAPELNGVTDLTFSIGEKMDLFSNVTAFDKEDGDITDQVEVDASELNPDKRGTYFITYRIVDSDGAEVQEQATVTINDPKVISFDIINKISTLNKGQIHQLEISATTQDHPDETVQWSSNNKKVMTVDEKGMLSAHAPGQAAITAKMGSLSSTIEITVDAPLENISLNKKDYSLILGKKDKLEVTYNPIDTTDSKNVIWSSSSPKTVSVDAKGNLEALSEGTAVITAKVGTVTASVRVTVPSPSVIYSTHVQSIGWQKEVKNQEMAGTTGKSKRLEGIKISLEDVPYSGGVEYQTHVESYGWMSKVSNGSISGTEGKSKRLEAIRINLTGEAAEHYDIYYRVHAQSFGWLDWAKNGDSAGTEGLAKRLEGIEIVLVKKGDSAPGNTKRSFVRSKPIVNYSTHVQKQGWQEVVSNGAMSGTSGKALRLEGILIDLYDSSLSGGIQYRTHVEKLGWQNWKTNWEISGTQGKALRLEAIEIKLTEEMAQFYDVYYRVHAQSYGWLDWAKNGESAGTEGWAKRLEGIEIRLVLKNQNAPGSTSRPFVKK